MLHGIERHLSAPELLAEDVQEFHRALAELRNTAHDRRAELSKRLDEIEKSINAIVVIADGQSSRALTERGGLNQVSLPFQLGVGEAVSSSIALHPDAANGYREKVKDLRAALNAADEENRTIAYKAIRELLEVVVIRPDGPYKPVEIDVYGRIQSLFPQNKTEPESMGVLVAGARNNRLLIAPMPPMGRGPLSSTLRT